ncbi:MAG: tyrosine--tRNA ligase [Holosporaceae bacterium]|nr:tyrosine--tRNA ligase [Holosporaceae bacterium]
MRKIHRATLSEIRTISLESAGGICYKNPVAQVILRNAMKYKSSFLNEASARGFFYQSTNLDAMDEFLTAKGRLGYLGFDVTAKSLHVGHLIPIFLLRLFQKHGHRPILLMGGGTTKIGDPSFKSAARPILTDEEIQENLQGIKSCLRPFLKFGDGKSEAALVNNADWLDRLEYVPFLREVGKYFSINRMIGFDSVKTKLTENDSLSFLEFNYMILQAYDFYRLWTDMGCRIQFGGQDQWGNIVCGVELIRKKAGNEVFGFTNPLLITSDGKKMGKTAAGAVWLSEDLLPPYDFWQYWRNVNDADVIKLLYLFTDIELEEIRRMESVQGQELNDLKILLANEVTAIAHGRDSLSAIHQTTSGIFGVAGGDPSSLSSIPRYHLERSKAEGISLVDILVESGECGSRGDAKRLLRGGGVQVNDRQADENYRIPETVVAGDFLKLSCGKKRHLLVIIE